MVVKVHITFCSGVGYTSRVRKLRGHLQHEFPDLLEITSQSMSCATGILEVEVNGKLVHSKKNGDGFVDTEKLAVIDKAIKEALE